MKIFAKEVKEITIQVCLPQEMEGYLAGSNKLAEYACQVLNEKQQRQKEKGQCWLYYAPVSDNCPEPVTIKKEDKKYWIMAFEGVKSIVTRLIDEITETHEDITFKNPRFGLQLTLHDGEKYNFKLTVDKEK